MKNKKQQLMAFLLVCYLIIINFLTKIMEQMRNEVYFWASDAFNWQCAIIIEMYIPPYFIIVFIYSDFFLIYYDISTFVGRLP